MSDEKKSWLDRAGAVHLWKTIEAMLGTKVDKIEGFGLSSNDYTTEEKNKLASLSDPNVATTESDGLMSSADKAKLDGIEAGANNYTHPVYEAKQAGLYRISVDNTGHVTTADKMTSEELAAEGVSPADHTHDLGELVDTLETSADAVEDADIVMVGATVTSDDGSATTKYTRRPLAALWNWIKAKTDTLYAAVGHTHKVNELENYDTHVYNPTLDRTKRTVLAAPTGTDGPATFRALDKNDVGLGNVDNVAALPLTGGTMSGRIVRNTPSSWIDARNTTAVYQAAPYDGCYKSVVGQGTQNGVQTIGALSGQEYLYFEYTSDSDYASGNNVATSTILEPRGGTIVTTANVGEQTVGNATNATILKYQGNIPAISGTSSDRSEGLQLYGAYDNGYATTYGNVICVKGLGSGELLLDWCGGDGKRGPGRLYYRNRSDQATSQQSDQATVAYTSDIPQGVSAYGSNYVRFGDGTQICWGSCGNNSFSSFGAAFANTDYRIGMSEWKSSSWENYAIGGKSTTGVTLRSENNTMEYIAIGRWK